MFANCLVFFRSLSLHSRACLGLSALTQPWASSGLRMRISRMIWLMWVHKTVAREYNVITTSQLHILFVLICPISPVLWLHSCVLSLSQVVDDHCPHFNSIELLKDRPTHLLVFMQHVILQFDPAPLVRTTTPILQHPFYIRCASVFIFSVIFLIQVNRKYIHVMACALHTQVWFELPFLGFRVAFTTQSV